MIPLVPIAIGAAAFYALTRLRLMQGAPGQHETIPNDPNANPPTGGGKSQAVIDASDPNADFAGDLPDGGPNVDPMRMQFNTGGKQWAESFYNVCWLPASRVTLSAITPEFWKMALSFLSGGLTRHEGWGSRYISTLNDIKAAEDSAAIAKLIASLISNVPYIGQQLAMGVAALGQQAANSALETERGLRISVSSLRALIDPKQIDRGSAAILAPTWSGGEDPLPIDLSPVMRDAGLRFSGLDVMGNYPVPGDSSKAYAIRKRWLTMYQYGWVFPWLSSELSGFVPDDPIAAGRVEQGLPPPPGGITGRGNRLTANLRARMYRAADALSCMAFPNDDVLHGPAKFRSAVTYNYFNPILGAITGSIFPPTKEDQRLVNDAGQILAWDGSEWQDPAKTRLSDSVARQIQSDAAKEYSDCMVANQFLPEGQKKDCGDPSIITTQTPTQTFCGEFDFDCQERQRRQQDPTVQANTTFSTAALTITSLPPAPPPTPTTTTRDTVATPPTIASARSSITIDQYGIVHYG